nr:S1 RNA-binding domain-containing protein [Plantactinospora sp. BB1]
MAEIEDFGVFVEIGGVIGMVNCAELSWSRFDHPSDVVGVGDSITVMVLGVDLEREHVSLSLKALQPDPLAEFARARLGAVVRGEVTLITPIGFFVAVGDGIEGLVRGSHLDPAPTVGDKLTVQVAEINLVLRRVRLVPAEPEPS